MPVPWIEVIVGTLLSTVFDVVPIVGVLVFFQVFVLRRPIPRLRRTLLGLVYVVLGLALFLVGLEIALFPIGRVMASQLTDPDFLGKSVDVLAWYDYGWVYLFALAIGFATTIAEPSLIAIAAKAGAESGGAIRPWGFRVAVAVGVAVAVMLGAFRIVTGTPLHVYMIGGYLVVVVQTLFAPKEIVPLAYDSGGVTTSTVTVPLVVALGLGLAAGVPGRSPLLDGFGLIALASLFPMVSVMGYAQVGAYIARRSAPRAERSES